ncbi:MAG: hypothetical protein L0J40_08620 [Alkalibacterium sp.]|nr:hypothetical protein [Alkalibacterium sp.]
MDGIMLKTISLVAILTTLIFFIYQWLALDGTYNLLSLILFFGSIASYYWTYRLEKNRQNVDK